VTTDDVLGATFRAEWPRILAAVVRYTGSMELAEDAVQQAFERAVASPDRNLLINPAAWITTVAKRIAVDTVRRDAALRTKLPLLAEPEDVAPSLDLESPAGDDRLGLLFAASTPALSPESRLALALRFVCGLPTSEIAAVMLVGHTAMSARITRAKQQIERDGIRFAPPEKYELGDRLGDVLGTIHALYTAGHTATASDELGSRELVQTALELSAALRRLAPNDREVAGLEALLVLTDARDMGRTDSAGRVVTLEHADRSLWDDARIRHGLNLAAFALAGGGRFALQAGISGLHSQAADWASTDWESICALYDRLWERWPSPAVRTARIIARSYSAIGPAAALDELDALTTSAATIDRQVAAARADILRRVGRAHEARAAYMLAQKLEQNAPIRAFFDARIDELDG
jgi:RNA polymerase sigma-70 factor, ECF subfamily